MKFDNQITAISKRIDKLNDKKKELGEQLKYSSQMAKKVERLETALAEIFDRISMKNWNKFFLKLYLDTDNLQ